jgi:hypothetical protein
MAQHERLVSWIVLFVGITISTITLLAEAKAPIPDAKAFEAGQKAAREIYGSRFTQAKTAAQKVALAKEMLETAAKIPDGSVDQYALLRIAGDIAAGAGEAGTALMAVERLAARFDVSAAKLKAEALLTVARQASLSSQQRIVAEATAKVLDELEAVDEYQTARALCEAARGCARTTKQYPLVKDLSARADELEQRAAAYQEYKSRFVCAAVPGTSKPNLNWRRD